jgi:hypothetical protein
VVLDGQFHLRERMHGMKKILILLISLIILSGCKSEKNYYGTWYSKNSAWPTSFNFNMNHRGEKFLLGDVMPTPISWEMLDNGKIKVVLLDPKLGGEWVLLHLDFSAKKLLSETEIGIWTREKPAN